MNLQESGEPAVAESAPALEEPKLSQALLHEVRMKELDIEFKKQTKKLARLVKRLTKPHLQH